jgi:tetratricopeptide (TPR) repeat protein
MAARSRLVVLLDDLQWGDADSAALLRQLLAPPDPPPVLFVGCYRSEDRARSPFLQAMAPLLQDARDARPLELMPFDDREARELASSLLPEGERQRARDIALLSGGSPIFIELIARHAREAPLAGLTMEEALLRRVRELPGAARRLLDVVVAAGQPVDARAVHLAAEAEAAGGRLLAQLKSERLVRTAGASDRIEVEVYHDRIRSVVQEAMAAREVARLRLALARALEQTGTATPELLYALHESAGEPQRAAHYAATAARAAALALAFDQAARFYRLALKLDPHAEDLKDLRAGLADALIHAGRGSDAAEVLLEAAAQVTGAESLELRRRAADQLLRAGLIDEGLAVLDQVLQSLGWRLAKTPWRASVRFILQSNWLALRRFGFRERSAQDTRAEDRLRVDTSAGVSEALSLVDNVQAAAFAARAARLALRLGDPARVARSLAALGAFWGFRSRRRRRRATEALATASAIADRLGDVRIHALTSFARAAAAYGQGHFQECVDLCRLSLAQHKESGSSGWERSSAEILLFSALVYVGRWGDIRLRLPALLHDARERGDRFLTTHVLTRQLCFARLMVDDPKAAERAVEEGLAAWTQRGFHMQHYWGLLGRTEIALYEGDGRRAWRLVSDQLPQLRRSLLHRSAVVGTEVLWLYGRAGLAAAAVEGPRVLEATRFAAKTLRRHPGAGADACGLSLEGGLLWHQGHADEAVKVFTRAAQSFEASGLPGYAALTRRCLGVIVGDEEGARARTRSGELLAAEGVVAADRLRRLYHPLPALSAEGS